MRRLRLTGAIAAAFWLALHGQGLARGGSGKNMALEDWLRRFPIEELDGRKVVRVSLRDVLELALDRSLSITAAEKGVDVAQQALIAARGRLYPNLTTTFGQQHSASPFFSPTLNLYRSMSLVDSSTVTSQLTKKDELGIAYGLTYQDSQSRIMYMGVPKAGDPVAPLQLGPATYSQWSAFKNANSLTGSVTVPLFQDRGRDVNTIPERQAEVGLQSVRYQTFKTQQDVLNVVAQTYWNLVGALENVSVQHQAVALSEKLLADNKVRLQAGVLSPADVQVSEAQLARDRQTLLAARSQVLSIEDQVRAALNLEGMLDVGLQPKDAPALRAERFELTPVLEKVYRINPDLALLKTQLDLNNYTLIQAQNKDRTKLDLNMFYVLNGFGNDYLTTQYWGDANTPGYGATITYTLPLFDQVTPSTIQQRILEREQIETRVRDLESTISVQVQSVLRGIRLAQEQVETARVALQLAEVQLNNEIERYKLGRSTAFTVSQLQQNLNLARQLEIQARVTFEQTDLQRLLLTGLIYKQFQLPEPPGVNP